MVTNMPRLEDLVNWFEDKKRVIVALSGGVDSALVAYAAFEKLQNNAIAVTADYKTMSQEELDSSKQVCSEIGIRQILLEYNELKNENFVKNDSDRCFHCRMELGNRLLDLANSSNANLIVDGTNLDDLRDFRPGIKAMQQNGIRSPLVETNFTKSEIRETAKLAGLSVYDRPSNSCLASRIPWGQRVTSEKLARIEFGESLIKKVTKIRQVRIRDINGSAKIEVERQHLPTLDDDSTFSDITAKLKLIGFSSVTVDPDGYSPGKINVIQD